ncbi:MAG: peptide-methionine (S)-S-oxide reductase [Candidatus Marinimicrobia bacterium]|nr:peptide-methionine (S)-S-oxide reductase [Candidatus Neomarinimicrobiota bacterium]
MGYAGGTTQNPTYHNIGDHAETLQIEFDPDVITYRELLNIYWDSHTPTRKGWSKQYQAFVFYHTAEQHEIAEESKKQLWDKLGKEIKTEIQSLNQFYIAEDYHQKYYLQNSNRFMKAFENIYPDMDSFINSTAAARVNGYLGGYGAHEQFRREEQALGLPGDLIESLDKRVKRNSPGIQCAS